MVEEKIAIHQLVISALLTTTNLILLPSTILFEKRKVIYISLINSSCSRLAFIDYKFIV